MRDPPRPRLNPPTHPARVEVVSDAGHRREELKAVWEQASGCQKCPQLASTRQTVVFGAGNADADLMFVGEAPGAREDERGLPFVGQAGRLLDQLLGEIGLQRGDVFVANVLKCLRYNAPVQLGDGSWERISTLVRTRYSGTVMSVDSAGRLVPRRVTGWHATPLGDRSVYRLTYRSAKRVGNGRVGIELTGDHPVLTERGYVRTDQLRPGDRVATGQGLSGAARDSGVRHLARRWLHHAGAAKPHLRPLGPSGGVRRVQSRRTRGTRARDGRSPRRRRRGRRADVPRRALSNPRPSRARPDPGRLLHALEGRPPAALERLERTDALRAGSWMTGTSRMRPPRQPLAEIAAVSFSDADLQVLLQGLHRLGLAAQALRGRIHFGVGATRALSELIAPYVPPTMRYKLHPDVEAAIPFDLVALGTRRAGGRSSTKSRSTMSPIGRAPTGPSSASTSRTRTTS